MLKSNGNVIAKSIVFVVSVVLIVAATWAVLNRQHVIDQVNVWAYEPTEAVQAVNDRSGFTEQGNFLFYATQPVVATQEQFNTGCPRQEVGSPILGCYTGDGRIYIYDITNPQLDGMEEVTAVHEMLHAVWARLSDAERDTLTGQLIAAYGALDDADLTERMEYYERTEPGEFANELHSILATEYASLSPELEAHYAKYFDRATILALHDSYSAVYDALYDRADELYAEMDVLSTSIEERLAVYNQESAHLSADIAAFNARAASGDFTSMPQFYSERAVLVSRSNELEADRTAINNDIATFNSLQKEYEDIAAQIEVLNDSIDSFTTIDDSPSL